jgi:hypothetical protein
MKKIIIALAAVAALSAPALAERSSETGDRSDYVQTQDATSNASGAAALQNEAVTDEYVSGRYGVTRDPAEVRRWDEKNN